MIFPFSKDIIGTGTGEGAGATVAEAEGRALTGNPDGSRGITQFFFNIKFSNSSIKLSSV